MREWITSTMNALGYPGIALLMFLGNIVPFIPSELIMPLAGFATTQGRLSFVGVVIAGTIGSVVGQLPLYYLGNIVGEERLKAWADQYGKWFTVSSKEIERAKSWFDQYGAKAVLFARLVPGVRSLISIPAGIADMNLPAFLLYSALGIAPWMAMVAYLGRLLSENFEKVLQYLEPVGSIVLGIIALVAIAWVVKRKMQGAGTEDGM